MTLAEVADVVGGRLHNTDGTPTITASVEFDSRELTDGGLFVAMPGERVDGHDFAVSAIKAGAVGVLAARAVDAPAVLAPPIDAASRNERAMALAGDTDGGGAAVLAALAKLARHVVDRLVADHGLTVVGLTGSSGKTSTKDLIAALLRRLGPTVAPPGSFNNELGHPWTALRADEHTRYLVLELSARGPGHIAALCAVAPPRIGAVLNVGSAHIGEFGGREQIAKTKGELVEALPPAEAGGVAVLNADDELVASMAARTRARVITVGRSESARIRAVDVTLDDAARPSFRLVTADGEAKVALALHGEHHVGNALTAAAVAIELGGGVDQVAQWLSAAKPVSGRRMEVASTAEGVTVINDSYNANPESMGAALHALAAMAKRSDQIRSARRAIAVLGVMGELGAQSDAAHAEIGRLAVRLGVDELVVIGPADGESAAIARGASEQGAGGLSVIVPDVDAAIAHVRGRLRAGDVVLVKASKVAGLWRVADALLASAGGNGGAR